MIVYTGPEQSSGGPYYATGHLSETIKKINKWGKIRIHESGFDFGGVKYDGLTNYMESRGFLVQESGYVESDPVVSPGGGGHYHYTERTFTISYRGVPLGKYTLNGSTASSCEDYFSGLVFAFNWEDAYSRNAIELLILTVAKGLGIENITSWVESSVFTLADRLNGVAFPEALQLSKMHLNTWGLLSAKHLHHAIDELSEVLAETPDHPGALAIFGYAAMASNCLEDYEAVFAKAARLKKTPSQEIATYFLIFIKAMNTLKLSNITIRDKENMTPIFDIGNAVAQAMPFAPYAQQAGNEFGFDFRAYFEYGDCVIMQINDQGVICPVEQSEGM